MRGSVAQGIPAGCDAVKGSAIPQDNQPHTLPRHTKEGFTCWDPCTYSKDAKLQENRNELRVLRHPGNPEKNHLFSKNCQPYPHEGQLSSDASHVPSRPDESARGLQVSPLLGADLAAVSIRFQLSDRGSGFNAFLGWVRASDHGSVCPYKLREIAYVVKVGY